MVSLQSRLTFCYICRIACTDILLTYTYLIQSLLSWISTPLSPLLHIGHIGTNHTGTSHLYRSSVYYSVGCGCFLTTQHHWTYHRLLCPITQIKRYHIETGFESSLPLCTPAYTF